MHDVKIKGLSFAYKNDNRLILKDINIDVQAGTFVALLGQSGCGKSTFLRLLAGLETATTGTILLDDRPVSGASLDKGMVFQDYGLFPWMTAGENIMLALKQRFPQQDKKKLKQLALDTLNAVGLDDSVYRKLPKELSGGMKQRCAIAQAFSIDPPDPVNGRAIWSVRCSDPCAAAGFGAEAVVSGESQKDCVFCHPRCR
ncbi:ABC transporter ATP-binding protein [Sporomusa sp. KB1]|jgi:NitT/TauT family transport system ATP-binding protein|uniref:ABC transporter ATP-binding protein n=1 Tax=Sporomusa sp. KB1 TaxID=943346 RepID=UPI0011AC9C6B|nr:ATP-binding cassette domain-containing protein [Sporomusa sp. KB1]TWH47224.1 NitT/TauT family transport system ATP-binding protein [Sporomusa sp. KB1]